MTRGTLRVLLLAASAAAAACSGASAPAIHLNTANPQQAVVEVSGLSRRDRAALSRVNLTDDEWSAVLRVTVENTVTEPGAAVPPIAGRYVVDDSVRFIPMFPLDPGRRYAVSFDASKVTRPGMPDIPNARVVVSLPAGTATPSTVVTTVYPSSEVIPENQLRMYVQFSGPMGQQGGLGHIALMDKAGQEITGAILPLDTELWNTERTRYTLLFDPGRVKREILPNRTLGRPLHRGQTFSLVVKTDWLDARGVPLKSEFRRQYPRRSAGRAAVEHAGLAYRSALSTHA